MNKKILISCLIFIGIGAILFCVQVYWKSRFIGDWRAAFNLEVDEKNTNRLELLHLTLNSDGTVFYETKTSKIVDAFENLATGSVTSTGFTRSAKTKNGKWSVFFNQFDAVFPIETLSETQFSPFEKKDFGIDRKTAAPFVKVSLKLSRVKDKLIVRGLVNEPKVIFSQDRDGHGNLIRFSMPENSLLAAQQEAPRSEAPVNIKPTEKSFYKTRELASEIREKPKQVTSTSIQSKTVETYRGNQSDEYLKERRSLSNLLTMKQILRELSSACETFATVNKGSYPTVSTDLEPPYLQDGYCNKSVAGFHFACQFSPSGYSITAEALDGSSLFEIKTVGVFIQRR